VARPLHRDDGDLVAVVVECRFNQHVGRQRAGQLDGRGVRRVAEVGADGGEIVALPLGVASTVSMASWI